MEQDLKYSFFTNWKLYFGLIILGLIIIGFVQNCSNSQPQLTVKTKEIKGGFKAVKPKQTTITQENKKTASKELFNGNSNKENTFLQKQIDSLLTVNENLLNDFSKLPDTIKIEKYADAIQLNSFSQKLENDTILINANGLVIGTIESLKINYNIKPITVDLPKQKEVLFRLLAGGGIGINKELNQTMYLVNVGFQNKKGNIINANYQKIASSEYYLLSYQKNIFTIKK